MGYALKSRTWAGDGTYILGSGTLENNISLTHKTYDVINAGPIKVGRDAGGHVVSTGALTATAHSNGAHTHNISIPASTVVTDVKKAAGSLEWAVAEMDYRYKCLSEAIVAYV